MGCCWLFGNLFSIFLTQSSVDESTIRLWETLETWAEYSIWARAPSIFLNWMIFFMLLQSMYFGETCVWCVWQVFTGAFYFVVLSDLLYLAYLRQSNISKGNNKLTLSYFWNVSYTSWVITVIWWHYLYLLFFEKFLVIFFAGGTLGLLIIVFSYVIWH